MCSYLLKHSLIKNVWSPRILKRSYESNSYFSLFKINFVLTEKGLENVEQVLEAFFSYLLFLKTSGNSKDYYEKLKQIAEFDLKHSLTRYSDASIEESSTRLSLYQPKDFLTGADCYLEFNEKQISAVVDALNQPNFNLVVLADVEFDVTATNRLVGMEYIKEVEFTYDLIQ